MAKRYEYYTFRFIIAVVISIVLIAVLHFVCNAQIDSVNFHRQSMAIHNSAILTHSTKPAKTTAIPVIHTATLLSDCSCSLQEVLNNGWTANDAAGNVGEIWLTDAGLNTTAYYLGYGMQIFDNSNLYYSIQLQEDVTAVPYLGLYDAYNLSGMEYLRPYAGGGGAVDYLNPYGGMLIANHQPAPLVIDAGSGTFSSYSPGGLLNYCLGDLNTELAPYTSNEGCLIMRSPSVNNYLFLHPNTLSANQDVGIANETGTLYPGHFGSDIQMVSAITSITITNPYGFIPSSIVFSPHFDCGGRWWNSTNTVSTFTINFSTPFTGTTNFSFIAEK